MANIQQLVKRVPQGVTNVSPITAVRAVKSEETGYTLDEILANFNMLFLSYNVSAELTRLQVPNSFRREGLWITYVTYDKTVVTEWYNSNDIDDNTWKSDANWRLGSNMLVGDISISSEGNWVINGVDTGSKAQGPQGISPILRNNQNKLEVSYDEGKTWSVISDYIAAWFRFTGTSGSSQADNIGKIQISRDNGNTWTDLSGEFTNSLHIKGYVATVGALPSSAVQGDIYGVGPTYDPSDTEQTNPIYQLYVKDSTGWVNNGKFTSIAAGVVQTLGTSETEVMSQKAITKNIDCYNVSKYHTNNISGDPAFGTNKFTLEQALTVVPNTFRYAGISIKFISSVTNVTETWFYKGTYEWSNTLFHNWVNIDAVILCTKSPLSVGMVNAKVVSSLPFIYKNCFDINTTVLQVGTWEAGYFYNGLGVLTQLAGGNMFYSAGTVDVSLYKGGMLFLTARSADNSYCGFKDSSGNLISTFQSSYGSATVNIPSTAATLFISNRVEDLPDQFVSVEVSNNKVYIAAKEADMQQVLSNMSTVNLDMKWLAGEYWTVTGGIGSVATYSRTGKIDVASYVGNTLIFYGRSIGVAYIVAFDTAGNVVNTFQTSNDLVSIPITEDMSTIGFSNRTASITVPYCTTGDFTKAAPLETVNNIMSVLPYTNTLVFIWEQGGISGDGTEQDSSSEFYPYRIRTTDMFEVVSQTIAINIASGFGYRVFEYSNDGTYLTYTNFDSGGYNNYTLQSINNKLRFNILYSTSSTPITPSISENADFVVTGLLGDSETLAKVASKKYVEDLISKANPVRNNLKNRKVSFIGDSITAGYSCAGTPYHKVFCDIYDAVDNPLGVGGTCIANNTKNGLSAQRFITRATQSNLQDSSLIVIFGGTNDFSYDSKPIGTSFIETSITPTGNIGNKKLGIPTDTDTFSGALHELIRTVRTNCPATPIAFVAPLQRGRYNANNPNSDESNSNGDYLSDFSRCIKEVCSFYSIPVLDLGSVSELDFMNAQISARYSSDNLHPNCAGHAIIGELLFRFVEDNIIID